MRPPPDHSLKPNSLTLVQSLALTHRCSNFTQANFSFPNKTSDTDRYYYLYITAKVPIKSNKKTIEGGE